MSIATLPRKPATLDEIDAEIAQRHLHDFIVQAWHIVEPATPFTDGWHIRAISEHLEAVTAGDIRNLLITIPPRHMKSLAVSVFWPVWEWIRWPERRWLFASYAASLSIRDSLKCRRLIESPWFQQRWGGRFQLTGDQNAKTRFDNDKTGYRIATSVGGSVTGEGGDRVICDDPHLVTAAASEAYRTAALTWWDESMSTRLNDPKTGSRVIVMQRVHHKDLAAHVIEQGGYEHLNMPAEYESTGARRYTSIGWTDPRAEDGELLWPARFGAAEIADLKHRLGSYAAAGQLQQHPAPIEGGMLKRNWWRFYTALPEGLRLSQSWDMTFKDTVGTDFVAGHVWGKQGANAYLVDRVHGRMDFPATLMAVRALTAKHPSATAKYVEDKANGTAVISSLKSTVPGLIAVNPEGGKVARVAAVSPLIEAGNVYLPDPSIAPWVGDFIEECAAFPNGPHDDDVDAMSQALLKMLGAPRAAFI